VSNPNCGPLAKLPVGEKRYYRYTYIPNRKKHKGSQPAMGGEREGKFFSDTLFHLAVCAANSKTGAWEKVLSALPF